MIDNVNIEEITTVNSVPLQRQIVLNIVLLVIVLLGQMISQFAWRCVNRLADTAWDLALLRYKGRLLSWHILVFLLPIVQPMGP